ncbi:MAG: hypothetical protein GY757_01655 [bacterium]|nr:hypothetical protein [bacterium]
MPEEDETRQRVLGDDMVKHIAELNYYLENSPLVRGAVINFFRILLFEERAVLDDELKSSKQM